VDEADVIVVTGVGTVHTDPDRVRATVGISTVALSVGEALVSAAAAQRRALDALAAAGVAAASIQTSGYRAGRDYEGPQGSSRQRVDVSLQIILGDVVTAGELLAKVSDAVGDDFRVDGVWPDLGDPSSARRTARAAAVAAARDQAEQLAAAAGVRLGRLRSLVEGGQSHIDRYAAGGRPMAFAAAGAPDVEGGELTIRVAVTATFEILS